MSDYTLESLNCRTEPIKTEITVGEVLDFVCDIKPAPQSGVSVRFEVFNSGSKPDYKIQVLGEPKIQGERITQKITSYVPGGHEISHLRLKIGETTFQVPKQNLNVVSVIKSEEGVEPTPFPLHGPIEISAPWWWWALWGVLFLALSFGAYKYYVLFKKRRDALKILEAEKNRTPAERFHMGIRRLESSGKHLRGDYKGFAFELTSLFKRAINSTFKISSDDMTTEELLKALKTVAPQFMNQNGGAIESFLQKLDHIKFADAKSSPEECTTFLDSSLKLGDKVFGAQP